MEILRGGRRVPAGVAGLRDEAMASKTTCHGLLSTRHRYGLLSAFRSGGPCPVNPVHVCPEGLQSAEPPFLVELLGGGVMSVLCHVCHVFPPHVSIFGLFPVLV